MYVHEMGNTHALTDEHVHNIVPMRATPMPVAVQREPIRRPRGRPAGSKNKPKPPLIITRESGNSLRAHAMEVNSGSDICQCLANFARREQHGLCVLSGSGCVINVALRQASSSTAVVTLHGRFEILSLLGSFFPPPSPSGISGLTVNIAGAQGQAVGRVVGPLIASGPVVIMSATFMNATFDRLPFDNDENLVHNQNHHYTLPTDVNNMCGVTPPPSLFAKAVVSPELYPSWTPGCQIYNK
ncbi:AT hook motif DNA-binding family protein [Zostera marina]|uniref:AT hook motif DNA-binding family protein n=1 Tax=Zostera marina TaxID=29655 RepID=A0A0K9PHW1_ZOSMR|nr:AT hook motif DNA-binding family protein [Zostera marina]